MLADQPPDDGFDAFDSGFADDSLSSPKKRGSMLKKTFKTIGKVKKIKAPKFRKTSEVKMNLLNSCSSIDYNPEDYGFDFPEDSEDDEDDDDDCESEEGLEGIAEEEWGGDDNDKSTRSTPETASSSIGLTESFDSSSNPQAAKDCDVVNKSPVSKNDNESPNSSNKKMGWAAKMMNKKSPSKSKASESSSELTKNVESLLDSTSEKPVVAESPPKSEQQPPQRTMLKAPSMLQVTPNNIEPQVTTQEMSGMQTLTEEEEEDEQDFTSQEFSSNKQHDGTSANESSPGKKRKSVLTKTLKAIGFKNGSKSKQGQLKVDISNMEGEGEDGDPDNNDDDNVAHDANDEDEEEDVNAVEKEEEEEEGETTEHEEAAIELASPTGKKRSTLKKTFKAIGKVKPKFKSSKPSRKSEGEKPNEGEDVDLDDDDDSVAHHDEADDKGVSTVEEEEGEEPEENVDAQSDSQEQEEVASESASPGKKRSTLKKTFKAIGKVKPKFKSNKSKKAEDEKPNDRADDEGEDGDPEDEDVIDKADGANDASLSPVKEKGQEEDKETDLPETDEGDDAPEPGTSGKRRSVLKKTFKAIGKVKPKFNGGKSKQVQEEGQASSGEHEDDDLTEEEGTGVAEAVQTAEKKAEDEDYIEQATKAAAAMSEPLAEASIAKNVDDEKRKKKKKQTKTKQAVLGWYRTSGNSKPTDDQTDSTNIHTESLITAKENEVPVGEDASIDTKRIKNTTDKSTRHTDQPSRASKGQRRPEATKQEGNNKHRSQQSQRDKRTTEAPISPKPTTSNAHRRTSEKSKSPMKSPKGRKPNHMSPKRDKGSRTTADSEKHRSGKLQSNMQPMAPDLNEVHASNMDRVQHDHSIQSPNVHSSADSSRRQQASDSGDFSATPLQSANPPEVAQAGDKDTQETLKKCSEIFATDSGMGGYFAKVQDLQQNSLDGSDRSGVPTDGLIESKTDEQFGKSNNNTAFKTPKGIKKLLGMKRSSSKDDGTAPKDDTKTSSTTPLKDSSDDAVKVMEELSSILSPSMRLERKVPKAESTRHSRTVDGEDSPLKGFPEIPTEKRTRLSDIRRVMAESRSDSYRASGETGAGQRPARHSRREQRRTSIDTQHGEKGSNNISPTSVVPPPPPDESCTSTPTQLRRRRMPRGSDRDRETDFADNSNRSKASSEGSEDDGQGLSSPKGKRHRHLAKRKPDSSSSNATLSPSKNAGHPAPPPDESCTSTPTQVRRRRMPRGSEVDGGKGEAADHSHRSDNSREDSGNDLASPQRRRPSHHSRRDSVDSSKVSDPTSPSKVADRHGRRRPRNNSADVSKNTASEESKDAERDSTPGSDMAPVLAKALENHSSKEISSSSIVENGDRSRRSRNPDNRRPPATDSDGGATDGVDDAKKTHTSDASSPIKHRRRRPRDPSDMPQQRLSSNKLADEVTTVEDITNKNDDTSATEESQKVPSAQVTGSSERAADGMKGDDTTNPIQSPQRRRRPNDRARRRSSAGDHVQDGTSNENGATTESNSSADAESNPLLQDDNADKENDEKGPLYSPNRRRRFHGSAHPTIQEEEGLDTPDKYMDAPTSTPTQQGGSPVGRPETLAEEGTSSDGAIEQSPTNLSEDQKDTDGVGASTEDSNSDQIPFASKSARPSRRRSSKATPRKNQRNPLDRSASTGSVMTSSQSTILSGSNPGRVQRANSGKGIGPRDHTPETEDKKTKGKESSSDRKDGRMTSRSHSERSISTSHATRTGKPPTSGSSSTRVLRASSEKGMKRERTSGENEDRKSETEELTLQKRINETRSTETKLDTIVPVQQPAKAPSLADSFEKEALKKKSGLFDDENYSVSTDGDSTMFVRGQMSFSHIKSSDNLGAPQLVIGPQGSQGKSLGVQNIS